MEIREMKYMIAIVKEGSLSKATDKLYISQPVLSRLVVKMENFYQVQIFNKNRLPWKLTPAGEVLIREFNKIIEIDKNIAIEMQKFSEGLKGRLIIGTMPLEECYLLTETLPLLQVKYSNFEIETIIGFSEEVENLLLANVADVGLVVEPIKNMDIETIPLITYKLLLVTSLKHPLAKNYQPPVNGVYSKVKTSVLGKYPLAIHKEGLGFRDIVLDFFEAIGIKPNIAMTISGFEATNNFIKVNRNKISFTLDELPYLKHHKDIAYFEIEDHMLTQTVAFAYKKGHVLTDIEKTLFKMIKEKINWEGSV